MKGKFVKRSLGRDSPSNGHHLTTLFGNSVHIVGPVTMTRKHSQHIAGGPDAEDRSKNLLRFRFFWVFLRARGFAIAASTSNEPESYQAQQLEKRTIPSSSIIKHLNLLSWFWGNIKEKRRKKPFDVVQKLKIEPTWIELLGVTFHYSQVGLIFKQPGWTLWTCDGVKNY